GVTTASLGLDGTEVFDVAGLEGRATAPSTLAVTATHPVTGSVTTFDVTVRVDTAREQAYLRAGGVLPFVLLQALRGAT
ncbi:MAG TPA: hypothetical protein VGE77_14710, partial [Nocardioides sp.]